MGLIAILPIVLIFKAFEAVPSWIVNPLSGCMPTLLAKILGLLILLVVIWCIGLFINQGKIGIALKKWVISIVGKIPVIGYLFRIIGQVINTLKYTASFKEVVLVEYPMKGKWAPAYVAQEYERFLALHLPSAPSAWTAPQLIIVDKKDVVYTTLSPKNLFNAVLTLGTAEDMKEIVKELEKVKKLGTEN